MEQQTEYKIVIRTKCLIKCKNIPNDSSPDKLIVYF